MSRFVLLGLAVSVLLSVGSARGQATDLVHIGVLDLTSENVPGAELRLLSDRLRLELFKTGRFQVLERERMEDILAEQGFGLSGCVATECIVEVGQLLVVQYMVAGSVGRVGGVHTINVRMINVETGAIEGIAIKDCRCPLEVMLTRVIGETARGLARGQPGTDARTAPESEVVWLSPQQVASQPADSTVDYSQFGRTKGSEALWLAAIVLVVLVVLQVVATSGG